MLRKNVCGGRALGIAFGITLSILLLAGSASAAGGIYAWGYNAYGQIGDGTTTDRPTPVQVGGLTGATAVAAGSYYSFAVKSDGTVWAWGYNRFGQLGDGTTTDEHIPVQVSGLTGVTAVAAGAWHSLAVKSDGTVWAWGINEHGQLGDGTTTDEHIPVQVSGLTGVTAVAAGSSHSLAVKSEGTVWAWGYNGYGQLGDGTTTDEHLPVQVSGLTGVIAVAAGSVHSLAVKSDGTVWAWGDNRLGQLGDGTTTQRLTPVQVKGLTGVTAVEAGGRHSLAVKIDGTVWAWGGNDYGQLGDGTTTQRLTPVQVKGLTGVTAVEAGDLYSLATKSISPTPTATPTPTPTPIPTSTPTSLPCNKELATSDPKSYWECLQNNNWGIKNIGVDVLHERGYYGEGKTVAIIDGVFDTNHPIYNYIGDGKGGIDMTLWKDWKLNVIEFVDYTYLLPDLGSHGTEVAGVVWETAPKAKFIIIKANLNEDRIKGIKYAISKGANVIITSMACEKKLSTSSCSDLDTAATNAVDGGTSFVASAGNSADGDTQPTSPSTAKNVLSISSIDMNNNLFGAGSPIQTSLGKPDLAAPGDSIYTLRPLNILNNDGSVIVSGSSFAAPHVAGALLLLQEMGYDAPTAETILKNTAIDVQDVDGQNLDGNGRVNIVPSTSFLIDPLDESSINTLTPTYWWKIDSDPYGKNITAVQINVWEDTGSDTSGTKLVLEKEYSRSSLQIMPYHSTVFPTLQITPPSSDYKNGGLVDGKSYHWHIRAYNGYFWSDWSNDSADNSNHMDFKVKLSPTPTPTPTPTTTPTPPTAGLVAEYHFDGDAKDSSGNGNHGSLINGATFGTGINGQALSLDGVDDYVAIPDSNSIEPQQLSIGLWVKPDINLDGSIGVPGVPILTKTNGQRGGVADGYEIQYESGRLNFGLAKNYDWRINLGVETTLQAGKWNYIAATYDRKTMELYLNGQLIGSIPESFPIYYGSDSIWIGKFYMWGGNYYYKGLIDEVKIYNRAFSADEIKTEYDSLASPTPTPTPPAPIVKGNDAVAVYNNAGTWALWNTTKSAADISGFGWSNTIPVVGDWNGDGKQEIGIYNKGGNNFFINTASGAAAIGLGWSGVTPVAGDWNGDSKDEVGVYDNNTGTWALQNASSPIGADIIGFGWSSTTPIVGDWNGDHKTKLGIYNKVGNNFLLRIPDGSFSVLGLGWSGVTPVVGDWNGDGKTKVGVYDASTGTWALENTSAPGGADIIGFGFSNTIPVVGDWNGDGKTEVGVYNKAGNNFMLRNSDGTVTVIGLGWTGVTPVVGRWS